MCRWESFQTRKSESVDCVVFEQIEKRFFVVSYRQRVEITLRAVDALKVVSGEKFQLRDKEKLMHRHQPPFDFLEKSLRIRNELRSVKFGLGWKKLATTRTI